MKLKENEFELKGKIIYKKGEFIEDEITKRIHLLVNSYLTKIDTSESGWEVLYQDNLDGRYWELIYEDSELQGGGAPSLINVKKDIIQNKYCICK